MNTSRLISYFVMLLALLSCAFSAPVTIIARDVWVPQITSPTSDSTWTVGGTFLVTWDTSSMPSEVTNPTGKIYLRQGDATQSTPIESGFALADGEVYVTVPDDTTPGMWRIVCEYLNSVGAQLRKLMVHSVFGDSGNWSDEFPIDAAWS